MAGGVEQAVKIAADYIVQTDLNADGSGGDGMRLSSRKWKIMLSVET